MIKDTSETLQIKIETSRKKFHSISKIENVTENLVIQWLIEANAIRCKFLKKVTTKNGNTKWFYKEPLATIIAPFENSVKQHPKRLPSVALVQCLQMDEPQEMSKEFNARNYKYGAVLCMAQINNWDETFEAEIRKKGGLSRVVKLYAEYCKGIANTKSDNTDSDRNSNELVDDVEEISHDYNYFKSIKPMTVFAVEENISKKYRGKIVLARITEEKIEVLKFFPEEGILKQPEN